MALVITVAQQKGGTGKTTLAANLGAAFAASRSVALLDIDPQRSLTRWHGLRASHNGACKQITLSELAGWRLASEIDRLARSYDVVLVDSPPQIETNAKLAIRAATLVLVPVQPSSPDVWAAEGTLALAAAERRPARIVLNRVPPVSKMQKVVLAELNSRHLPMFRSAIGNRTGFATAFSEGLGVTEASPRSTAATELRALADELMDTLQ